MFGGLKARAAAAAKSASAAMEDPGTTAAIEKAKARTGLGTAKDTAEGDEAGTTSKGPTRDWTPIAARVKATFRDFDRDKTSTISRERLFEVMQALDPSLKPSELNVLFDDLDKDKNGVLDYEEFVDWCGGPIGPDDISSVAKKDSSMWSRSGAAAAAASISAKGKTQAQEKDSSLWSRSGAAAAAASMSGAATAKVEEMKEAVEEMKEAAWDLCPLPSASELQQQFDKAAGSDDQNRINQLLDSALATQASDVPGVRSAANRIAKEQLLRAVGTNDRTQIKGALISAKRLWATELPEYELATQKYRELAKIPDGWDVAKMVEERKQGKLMVRAEITDPAEVAKFQRLLDGTVRMKWTRDRRDDPKVPRGYDVVKVMQVQNEELWTEYVIRQEEIRLDMSSKRGASPGVKARPRCSYGASCYRKNPAHRSDACHPGDWDWDLEGKDVSKPYHAICTQSTLKGFEPLPGPLLDDSVTEVFLFHGTNPIAVEKITSDNFSVNFAGSSTGTLYGRGLYFAEHCTKADEYAKADDSGLHTLLICRVTLGDALYTPEAEPDARLCEDTCMRGEKHSILGDRIACRDTFREFVVFDEAQIYANFVVQYKRREAVDVRKRY